MHLSGFGKANGFSHHTFDPGAQREMFPLQLLCSSFAHPMSAGIQVPAIGSPAVSVKSANAEGFKRRFEFYESLILAVTEDLR